MKRERIIAILFILISVFVLAGCDDSKATEIPVKEIKFEKTELTLVEKETYQLKATILPAEANQNAKMTWTSDNEAVATVSDKGLVTAKGNGIANITVLIGEVKASVQITVIKSVVSITGIQLDKTDLSFDSHQSYQLKATILPAEADQNAKMTWTSDNEAVATVSDNGLVEAVGNGSAKITASIGKIKAEVNVTVAFISPEWVKDTTWTERIEWVEGDGTVARTLKFDQDGKAVFEESQSYIADVIESSDSAYKLEMKSPDGNVIHTYEITRQDNKVKANIKIDGVEPVEFFVSNTGKSVPELMRGKRLNIIDFEPFDFDVDGNCPELVLVEDSENKFIFSAVAEQYLMGILNLEKDPDGNFHFIAEYTDFDPESTVPELHTEAFLKTPIEWLIGKSYNVIDGETSNSVRFGTSGIVETGSGFDVYIYNLADDSVTFYIYSTDVVGEKHILTVTKVNGGTEALKCTYTIIQDGQTTGPMEYEAIQVSSLT